MQLSFTDFKPDSNLSNPSTSKNFSIGSTILLTERWTFAPSVGVNSTSASGANNGGVFNGIPLNGNVANEGSGWIANMNLRYLSSEKNTFQANLSRTVSPGGLGVLQKIDTFGLGYIRELSQVSRAGVDFNISKNQSNIASETMQLTGFYSQELSRDWQMRLIAGHRAQKQNTLSANNTNVGISLIYNIPQF